MAAVAPPKLQSASSPMSSRFAPHSPSPLSASASSSSDSLSSLSSSSSASSVARSSQSHRPAPAPRTASFPASRPLRPFASIAHSTFKEPVSPPAQSAGRSATAPAPDRHQPAAQRKPGAVKLIQPPKNMPVFTLNLTQAEFSRRGY